LASVLIVCDVTDPVAAVFHLPMPADQSCDISRVSLVSGETGDAVDGFVSFRGAAEVSRVAVDAIRLVDAGEVQVGYVWGAGDFADLDPAVAAVKRGVVRGGKPRCLRRR
jgi:hypothetical protein